VKSRYRNVLSPSVSSANRTPSKWKLLYRLNPDSIVNRGPNSLFAAEVPLGGLDRDVSKKKLDLLQFPSRRMTQPGVGHRTVRLGRHPTTSRYNDQQPHLPVDDFSAKGSHLPGKKVAAVCDFAA
jgi:hypothetical protein